MKKPEIEDWGYDGIVISPQGGKVFSNEEIIEAYSEMIDALIEAYGELARLQSKECKEYDSSIIKIEKTLKKAGVEL